MSATNDLLLAQDNGVATLVLNRPAKKNALTVAMWAAIPEMLAPLRDSPSLRLLIVRGAGGAFAAGADIAEFASVYATREAALDNHSTIQAAMSAIESFPTPTLAAIDGVCVGGGCGLALACDMRIAARASRLAVTPGKLGLAYGVADTRRLVQAVGLSAAKDILFTGRMLSAQDALRVGLVDCVFPDETFDAEIASTVAAICAASSFTARATKTVLQMIAAGTREDTPASRALFADAFSGPDFAEGFRAFMEKRPPKF